MITRTVLVKLTDEWSTDAGRAAVAAHSAEALSAIPGVVSAEAGVPADDASRASWDVIFLVRFASMNDVEPYRVHPLHTSYLNDYLNPKAEVKKAWNWDSGA